MACVDLRYHTVLKQAFYFAPSRFLLGVVLERIDPCFQFFGRVEVDAVRMRLNTARLNAVEHASVLPADIEQLRAEVVRLPLEVPRQGVLIPMYCGSLGFRGSWWL